MNFGQKYHTKIRGVHPTWKLDSPAWTRTNNSDGWWQVPNLKIRHLWVDWRVSSPKTRPTWPNYKTNNIQQYLKVFQQKFTKTNNIWNFLTKIYLKSTRFGKISAGSREIIPDRVRSSTDLVEILSDLTRSQQIQWGLARSNEDLGWIQAVSTIA